MVSKISSAGYMYTIHLQQVHTYPEDGAFPFVTGSVTRDSSGCLVRDGVGTSSAGSLILSVGSATRDSSRFQSPTVGIVETGRHFPRPSPRAELLFCPNSFPFWAML